MFGIENVWLFIVSGILLNMVPGPDLLLVIGRTVGQGFKAGSVAALGICTGTLFHILAAALGLSAILATSAIAFNVVKVIGGLYLIYMAITLFRSRRDTVGESTITTKTTRLPLRKIYYQGLISNVFNPKMAVFFLAFVPQFISTSSDHKTMAFIVLGLIFNFNGMLWSHLVAWISSTIRHKLSVSKVVQKWLSRITASLFGFFGIRLLISTNN